MATRKQKTRLQEPSTHAGLAGAIAGLAPFVPPQYQWVAAALSVAAGAWAVYQRG